ncbi:HAD-IIA family hydrolase [Stackebrandtia soli]|uniref:HAD-IIA family hydrolase n=1 Tax=Stackebrandtia soli TaxID=1892856 RepID=UPI0039ED12CD
MTEHRGLADSSIPLSEAFDLALLDLDGVVYLMGELIPGADEAVAEFRRRGTVRFITNNASRSAEQVAALLTSRGVDASPDEVRTSAQALAAALATRIPQGGRVLIVGTTALADEIEAVGLVPVRTIDGGPAPVAVAQGISPDVTWRDLSGVVTAVRAGALWAVTNRDSTIPSPTGPLPGNGTLVAAVVETLGRAPDVVAGKPEPVMFQQTIDQSLGIRPIAVGDRHDTDIAAARAVRVPSLLVLSGTATPASVLNLPPDARPDYLGWSLTALTEPHPPVSQDDSDGVHVWRCGHWRVESSPTGLTLTGTQGSLEPDHLDALRALTVAAWAVADDGMATPTLTAGDAMAKTALSGLGLVGD